MQLAAAFQAAGVVDVHQLCRESDADESQWTNRRLKKLEAPAGE